MSQTFRPYPEPGADTKGTFRLWPFLRDTILKGPFQFGGLVPHFVLPFYLAYRVLKGQGLYTEFVSYIVDGIVIPFLQGLAIGGIITTGYLRYGTQEGRLIGKKRAEDAATSEENVSQHRIEFALYAYMYLLFATFLWHHFPVADGPGIKSAKRLISRIQLGIDLGEGWRSGRK